MRHHNFSRFFIRLNISSSGVWIQVEPEYSEITAIVAFTSCSASLVRQLLENHLARVDFSPRQHDCYTCNGQLLIRIDCDAAHYDMACIRGNVLSYSFNVYF